MSPVFNIELTAIVLILVGLAGWIFQVGRKAVTQRDLAELQSSLGFRIDSKVSQKEATARYEGLRDDLKEIKETQVRQEEHQRQDNSAIREELQQLRDFLYKKNGH